MGLNVILAGVALEHRDTLAMPDNSQGGSISELASLLLVFVQNSCVITAYSASNSQYNRCLDK